MYCKNCGMICQEGQRYCRRCGEPLQTEKSGSAGRAAKKKSAGPLIAILIILLAVIVGLVVYILLQKKKQNQAVPAGSAWNQQEIIDQPAAMPAPEATLEKLESALDKLDVATAVEYFDSNSREVVETYINENLLSGIGNVAGIFSDAVNFELDVVDVNYEDDTHCTATVDGAMKIDVLGFEQSNALRIDVPLVYENGEWLIAGTSVLDLF